MRPARYCGDVLQLCERGRRFELNDQAQRVAGGFEVITHATVLAGTVHDRHAPGAERRVVHGFDGCLRVFSALHIRQHDRRCTRIQKTLEQDRVIAGNPYDRRRARSGQGPKLAHCVGQLQRRVLAVEQHPVEARSS
jgi:hypothetical protein